MHSVPPQPTDAVSWRWEFGFVWKEHITVLSRFDPVPLETKHRTIKFLAREHGPWIWFSDPATVSQTCCLLNYFCAPFLPIDIGITTDLPLIAKLRSRRLQVPQFFSNPLYNSPLPNTGTTHSVRLDSKRECTLKLNTGWGGRGGLENLELVTVYEGRSWWPCGLSCRSAAALLLGYRVRIPLRTWMFVSRVCCVGSGLCDEPITRSEESYYVCVFNLMW